MSFRGGQFDMAQSVNLFPETALRIENTNASLVIRNVRFSGYNGSPLQNAIFLDNVSNISILDSLVSERDFSVTSGIFIENSSQVLIENNGLTGPGRAYARYSKNITIVGNSFFSSGLEIWMDHSSGVLVYHNNFWRVSDTVATDTSPSADLWDDGYPVGGNYWDPPYPTGASPFVDNCSGPRQDIYNEPDGIADSAISIPAFGKPVTDRYPLASPYGLAPDIIPPTLTQPGQPTALMNVTAVTTTGVTITWPIATDNLAVAGYRVYLGSEVGPAAPVGPIPCYGNGTLVGTIPASSHTFTLGGLSASTTYYVWVEASDAADNTSCLSAKATTLAFWQQYWYLIAGGGVVATSTTLVLQSRLRKRRNHESQRVRGKAELLTK